jgi:hypothetical protein
MVEAFAVAPHRSPALAQTDSKPALTARISGRPPTQPASAALTRSDKIGLNAPPLPDLPHTARRTTPAGILRLFGELMCRQQSLAGTMRRWNLLNIGRLSRTSADLQGVQVQGERESAKWNVLGGMLGFLVGTGLSAAGAAMGLNPGRKDTAAIAAGLQAAGQAANQLSSAVIRMLDTSLAFGGGSYKASEARTQKALIDYLLQVQRSNEGLYQNSLETSKRNVERTLSSLKEINDLTDQVTRRISG